MAEKERVAKKMAEKERKALEKAEKMKRKSFFEGDDDDDAVDRASLSPEKLVLSWDRKSRKANRRSSEERRTSRRPASLSGTAPRRARSDDQRYRSSTEDLTHPSVSPPCTCDLDSDGEHQETVKEVPLVISEGPETPSLFSPTSRHSAREDKTFWDHRTGVLGSLSTLRTASRTHGKVSTASSRAFVIGADVRNDDRRLVSTSPRSRSRPSTQERRRESSSGRKSVARPRSHSGGVHDRHILHYPHHFEGVCQVHDGRQSGTSAIKLPADVIYERSK